MHHYIKSLFKACFKMSGSRAVELIKFYFQLQFWPPVIIKTITKLLLRHISLHQGAPVLSFTATPFFPKFYQAVTDLVQFIF